MLPDRLDELLSEQLAYYRCSAREYDEANRMLLTQPDADGESRRRGYRRAMTCLSHFATGRDVLEIAGGTGMYTRQLVRLVSRLTVVDASSESLEINQSSISNATTNVEYVLADIFSWEPPRRYEVVVFAFWLSHVPRELFDRFWEVVDRALAPGGPVVVIDAPAPAEPVPVTQKNFFTEQRVDDQSSIRSLADGRQFRIVRILWAPADLRDRLASLGWRIQFNHGSAWLIASVQRSGKS